jgi:hypothetical protein
MDLEILKEWLIQNGVPQEELDNVEPLPIVQEVDNIKSKTKTAKEIYEELLQNESASLEELKQARINFLKDECTQAIYEGFTSSLGYEFGFNAHDQQNFGQQLLLLMLDTNNTITEIQWKTKNQGVVELTKEEFLQIVEEAKQHKLNQQHKYWMKEELVLVSQSKDEVASIVW